MSRPRMNEDRSYGAMRSPCDPGNLAVYRGLRLLLLLLVALLNRC